MKKNKISIQDIDRLDDDPLDHLDKKTTKRLDSFYSMSDDDEALFNQKRDPEYKAVQRFLNYA